MSERHNQDIEYMMILCKSLSSISNDIKQLALISSDIKQLVTDIHVMRDYYELEHGLGKYSEFNMDPTRKKTFQELLASMPAIPDINMCQPSH